MATELIPGDYSAWLESVKSRIQSARSRAALAVNAELIQLYPFMSGKAAFRSAATRAMILLPQPWRVWRSRMSPPIE